MSNQPVDVGALTRATARNHIGSPRPTYKRSARKAGASRTALDPTLNSPGRKFLHLSAPSEFVEGAPRLVSSAMAHAAPPVEIRHRTRVVETPGTRYSPEVIAHANMLLHSQGQAAVAQYLANLHKPKEATPMSHSSIAENLSEKKEERKINLAQGSIETALNEALEKIAYHQNQIVEHQAETQRWEAVADSLKNVLELTAGPAAKRTANGGGGRGPSKDWRGMVRVILSAGKPMAREELYQVLRDRCEDKVMKQRMYPAIKSLLGSGFLLENADQTIGLAEWTNPTNGNGNHAAED